MATVTGTLLSLDTDRVALANGPHVLSLSTLGEPVPASLRTGDEVAGWRQGPGVRELRLARIRTDIGAVEAGPDAAHIRLDTGLRTWSLHARGWPLPPPGALRLKICHDGHLALWIADGEGDVWLPPSPRDCDDSVKGARPFRHTASMLRR